MNVGHKLVAINDQRVNSSEDAIAMFTELRNNISRNVSNIARVTFKNGPVDSTPENTEPSSNTPEGSLAIIGNESPSSGAESKANIATAGSGEVAQEDENGDEDDGPEPLETDDRNSGAEDGFRLTRSNSDRALAK